MSTRARDTNFTSHSMCLPPDKTPREATHTVRGATDKGPPLSDWYRQTNTRHGPTRPHIAHSVSSAALNSHSLLTVPQARPSTASLPDASGACVTCTVGCCSCCAMQCMAAAATYHPHVLLASLGLPPSAGCSVALSPCTWHGMCIWEANSSLRLRLAAAATYIRHAWLPLPELASGTVHA